MNGFQHIKRQLLPLIKGLPIVILIFLAFLFAAKKIISYSPNMYQTIAKIKLDDQKYGMSHNNLYSDFDVFSTENKISAEAEVLKSPILIEKALDSMPLDVVIYRKGKLKNTMLYNDSPLLITYDFNDDKLYNQEYEISVISETNFELSIKNGESVNVKSGGFGTPIDLNDGQILILKNDPLMSKRSIDLLGNYVVKFYSKKALIADLSSRLDVKAVDKEIAILRIVFKEEHPQKAADFVNRLCQAYLDDYVITKSNAANQTANFIEDKLNEVSNKLNAAERNLENFKKENGVVNTTQETETGLREISKLNIQLINLETTELSMKQALKAISEDQALDFSAVKFGFGDLLMTELVKKYRNLQDERHETLLKYKAGSEEVNLVETKILEVKTYLRQAIEQNLLDIDAQRASLDLQVQESSKMFDNLPTREKKHQILEREFRLQEDVYNFLSQKRIEASIASSAMISFHRIIQKAEVSNQPVSPNRVLVTFVMGLFGLIVGIGFIYVKRYIKARVMTRNDVEKLTTLPVLNVIRKGNKHYDFKQLAKGILLKKLVSKHQVISINSTLKSEGKTYVTEHLAKAMANEGYAVCVLKIEDDTSETNTHYEPIPNNVVEVKAKSFRSELVVQLKQQFDFVLIDSMPTAIDITGIEIMAASDLNLYIVRANHTRHSYVSYAEILKEEYELPNILLLLNDAHIATNYTGNFVGSRFQKTEKPRGFVSLAKYYYQTYLT